MIKMVKKTRRSFKDMTPKEREATRRKMLAIKVTDEEISQWDPLVFKIIKNVILQYWGRRCANWNPNDTQNEAMVGRLGMTLFDLMQCGRMFVCNQIRWYKLFGDPEGSKLGTLIFQYLNHKFQNMSRVATNKKHGGFIVNVASGRKILQQFLDTFDDSWTVEESQEKLREMIEPMSTSFKKNLDKVYVSNDAMKQFLYDTVVNMNLVVFHNYDELEPYTIMQQDMNPEEILIVKEQIQERMETLSPVKRRDIENRQLVFMSLANKMGINTRLKLARKLGTSLPTLDKIVNGERIGPNTYEKISNAMEALFDIPMAALMQEDE
jgi:hypothetical protein